MTWRGPKHGPRGKRLRRLQARLLLWFLVAIILAIGASIVTTVLTASDPGDTPTRVVSRHVQNRVAKLWDDPAATEAYVQQLREDTGLDIRVRRDPNVFPQGRVRPGGWVFEDGVAYVPIIRKGQLVGALELRTGAPAPQAWRVIVALLAAILVLGAVARRVSKHLARPLEHLAATAERFGSGDLTARTGIEKLPRRWVAEEVRDVGSAFDTMADRIARVVVEQRELLAAISHELRSPLGRARIALEIARERAENADKPLDDVEKQLVEIDAILGDLLASARAGLADVKQTPVEIGPWLGERIASETTGPVELEIAPDVKEAKLAIDTGLLGRAVHNLLANAWAHGHPKDVPLEVHVTKQADEEKKVLVRVAVCDRGPGFSAEILPRAFEPFVTGTGKARSPGAHGMGLGLALVRRIVEAHGGTASATNIERDGKIVGAEVAFVLREE